MNRRLASFQAESRSLSYGLIVHLLRLPTPPRGDAVAVGYRPERAFAGMTNKGMQYGNSGLVDDLLQNRKVPRIPRLGDDVVLVPNFMQHCIVDVDKVGQAQVLLGHNS